MRKKKRFRKKAASCVLTAALVFTSLTPWNIGSIFADTAGEMPTEPVNSAQPEESAVPTGNPEEDNTLKGEGTIDNPYLIYNKKQLARIGENVTAYYKLESNIDLEGMTWTPVGVKSVPFIGALDGNGYTISNVVVSTKSNNAGFFGYAKNARITDVTFSNIQVSGKSNVGAVAGYITGASAIIRNCTIQEGTVNGSNYVGGIIGSNGSAMTKALEECQVSGEVTAASGYAGGLAGNLYGTMKQCVFQGTVQSDGWEIGGLAGTAQKATISECYSNSTVSGSGEAGGLVGWAVSAPVVIEDSFSLGTVSVSEDSYVAGILANSSSNSNVIRNCYSIASIVGTGSVSSIVGGNAYVTSTYYDSQLHQLDSLSDYDTDRTTASMINKENYISWDFETVWDMEQSTYPYLRNVAKPEGITAQCKTVIGKGTEEDPFILTGADDLKDMKYQMSAWYKLGNSIDLGGMEWTPLGNSEKPFAGHFDGAGYTISNCKVDTGKNYASFFGYVRDAAIVDLTLEQISVTGKNHVGALAGYLSGQYCYMKDCHVKNGQIKGNCYVGGIIGNNKELESSILTDCDVSCQIEAESGYAGGIAGALTGKVSKCWFAGTVSSQSWETGGIAGVVKNAQISQCYSNGVITGCGEVGGIAGSLESGTLTVQNCFSVGTVTSTEDGKAGGILGNGDSSASVIKNSYSAADIQAQGALYGITKGAVRQENTYYDGEKLEAVNLTDYDTSRLTGAMLCSENFKDWDFENIWMIEEGITYPYLQGMERPDNITSHSDKISGNGTESSPFLLEQKDQLSLFQYQLTGYFKLTQDLDLGEMEWNPLGDRRIPFTGCLDGNGATISNLNVQSDQDNAGFFGVAKNAQFKNLSIKNAEINGKNYVGGFAGSFQGNMKHCFFQGKVNASGNYAGGLAGAVSSSSIEECGMSGEVEADKYAGGLAGQSAQGELLIKNAYARGQVKARSYLGGILGSSSGTTRLEQVYSAAALEGESQIGALAGDTEKVTIQDSFYDLYASHMLFDTTDYGKQTNDMVAKNTYEDWDFDTTWKIEDGVTYPYLKDRELPEMVQLSTINARLLNAKTGTVIQNAKILVRKGADNQTGYVYGSVLSDDKGKTTISNLPYGTYTLEIKEDSLISKFVTVTCNAASISLGDISVMPVMTGNTMTIVLTWGANPRDLDSHFQGNGIHVYYGTKNSQGVSLDVDRTSSYGPETITLDFEKMKEGEYTYSVSWYSGSGTWATSQAKVTVYMDNKIYAEYSADQLQGSGGTWNVFMIDTATRQLTKLY